jgi:DNA-directed RNA polymerase specialized sigma24 family protein
VTAIRSPPAAGDRRDQDEEEDLPDAPGFVAMYRREYPRVVRALEIGGLERAGAEDVAQEAFARTLGHWRRIRSGTNPPGYVFRVAFRLARKRFDEPVAEPRRRDLGDSADDAVLRVDLERALRTMPARRRSCALL